MKTASHRAHWSCHRGLALLLLFSIQWVSELLAHFIVYSCSQQALVVSVV